MFFFSKRCQIVYVQKYSNYFFYIKNISKMVLATVTVIAASVYLLSGHLSTKDTKHIVPFSIIRKTVDLECYIFADVKVSKLEAIDERSIFLVASACAPISARKACAIESAAISHPNWIVHVVIYGHTWIKRFHNIKGFVSKLQAYQNIVITKIVLPEYFAGTPLESLMTLESIKEIEFPEYFMSDLVKIATLYNHGGVYLSWDVIVERSFQSLPNDFFVEAHTKMLSSKVLRLSKKGAGQQLINDIARYRKNHRKAS